MKISMKILGTQRKYVELYKILEFNENFYRIVREFLKLNEKYLNLTKIMKINQTCS